MHELYGSRTDRSSASIARRGPVVYEDGLYADALTAEQTAAYERDGFLMLESVFGPDEVAALLDEVKRMRADLSIVRLEEAITEQGRVDVRSIFRVHYLSDLLGRLRSTERDLGKEWVCTGRTGRSSYT